LRVSVLTFSGFGVSHSVSIGSRGRRSLLGVAGRLLWGYGYPPVFFWEGGVILWEVWRLPRASRVVTQVFDPTGGSI